MKRKVIFSMFSLLFYTVSAQSDTIHLEDITISVSPFGERLKEASVSMSIIQPRISDVFSSVNIADQINTAPGVYMSSGTYTTNRLTIRGLGSRTPYSSNRIRAYYEEIPLTSGDGISNIEDIDNYGISRIEILRGPSSAMYGSGLGGLIKIKAPIPAKKGFTYHLSSGIASFNSKKNLLSVAWKNSNKSLIAGFSRVRSDGFRENNRYSRDQFFLHYNSGQTKNRYSFLLLASKIHAGIPSSLNKSDYLSFPEKAAASWLSVNGYESANKLLAGVSWDHQLNHLWTNKLSLHASFKNPYESRPFNILDDLYLSTGMREQLIYSKDNFQFLGGFELFHENYQWEIYMTQLGIQGDLQLKNSEIRRYGNLFAHASWNPVRKFNIEGGINFNILNYKIQTLYHSASGDQSGSYQYQPIVSPRLGLVYHLLHDLTVHAAAGHGFSAPSLEETLLPEGLINSSLRPETGWNSEAGIRGWVVDNGWYFDLTAYSIFVSDMLVTKRISEEVFSGINAGSAWLTGMEIFSKIMLNRARLYSNWKNTIEISAFLNKNRFTSFIDDGIDFSGKQLPAIPKQILSLSYFSSHKDKLELKAELHFSGKQYMNDANTDIYKGHFISNVSLGYKLSFRKLPFSLRINARVNNIFNSKYASMILVNAPSFNGIAPRYYYPGMPRNYSIGLVLAH